MHVGGLCLWVKTGPSRILCVAGKTQMSFCKAKDLFNQQKNAVRALAVVFKHPTGTKSSMRSDRDGLTKKS